MSINSSIDFKLLILHCGLIGCLISSALSIRTDTFALSYFALLELFIKPVQISGLTLKSVGSNTPRFLYWYLGKPMNDTFFINHCLFCRVIYLFIKSLNSDSAVIDFTVKI